MADEFCPQCGSRRVGAFRFCRSCGYDFDAVPAEPIAPLGPLSTAESVPTITAQRASSRRGWVVLGSVIFIAIVAAFAFIGLSNSGAFLPKHEISGTFTLTDADERFTGSCFGSGGYSDIRSGTNVVLKDGDGRLLATGSLGSGAGSGSECVFRYVLNDVPEVPFYTIEVGRRGDLSYSLAEMRSMGWGIDLTLGE